MKIIRRKFTILTAVIAIGLFSVTLVNAQPAQLGQATFSTGTLVVRRPDGIEDRLRGKGAVILFEQDVLRTESNSQALLDFGDGNRIGLNENSTVQIFTRWEKTGGFTKIVRAKQGEVWVKTGIGPKPIEVETSTGTAIVQNAEINFKVSENGQSVLSVVQGVVQFATAYGWCEVKASTSSSGARGRGCSAPTNVNAQQVAAWTRDLVR